MSETIFGKRTAGLVYTPRTSSYAVIRDGEGRIAFARGATHIWLVGGGAEADETEEETIRREALEETGRELTIHRLIGGARQYFDVDGLHYDMHSTFFEATLGDTVGAAEETIVWLDPGQADALIFHDSHRWAIAQHSEVQARPT